MQNAQNDTLNFFPTNRTGPFWTAFLAKGYTIEEARLNDKAMIRMVSPNGSRWVTSTNIAYPMISSYAQHIASDKFAMYMVARNAGLQSPDTQLLTPGESPTADLIERHGTVIVKPLDSYGSKGVSLNINTETDLIKAITEARNVSKNILIQQQVDGDELRFTILNGKVVSVLQRQSPRVVGDGVSTIARLIHQENQARELLKFEFITYPQLTAEIIDESWLKDETIPESAEVVQLSRATMVKKGASIFDVFDEVHDTYKQAAENLALALGTDFITVDIFIQDYEKPLASDSYWFNECNTAPALRLYYADKNNRGPAVAEAIINTMDAMLQSERSV